MSNRIIPDNFDKAIQDLDWYHPNADRHIACSLLMHNGVDGSYLLRPSKHINEPLVMSVRCKESVKHFPLTFKGQQICFGLATFDSPNEFVQHFEQQPFIAGESGLITWLKHPYPRNVAEPDLYDRVKIHAQYREKTDSPKPSHLLSVASKEGFMTKMGGLVKNWKVRWFVLRKNELKYFKLQTDPDPIRVLDLKDCTECSVDTTAQRPYCFRVVFPWRTFFFCCESEADRSEWVKLIQWKLDQMKTSTSATL